MLSSLDKALIHDWYTQYRGGERCVEAITAIWNDFEHFTLVNTMSDAECKLVFKGKTPNTSFIEKLPFGKKKYRNYLPFFPLAIEQFDLSKHELIISSSSCVAKGVLTRADQLHISYVHSPVRYAWDLYHQYIKESGLTRGLKGLMAKYFLHKLRLWDVSTANRPDYYIANSQYVAKRIKKIYNKEAKVIYPPVAVEEFSISDQKEDYFVTCSSLVPYKKIDLIVEAFKKLNKRLIVIGDGPEYKKLKRLGGATIELKGFMDGAEKKEILKKARAFVFAADEDFGIAPIEAQACGIPVIAYKKGGIVETVNGVEVDQDNFVDKTGVFYKHQTKESLIEAVHFFEKNESRFNPQFINNHAQIFSRQRFQEEFKETVEEVYLAWKKGE
ncbi:glycosyltransferase family 4 protein [Aquimarina brevivitae]|uniref:Glycosyltransferase involved in cell wall biosynthesis n=1 Tax=Aquimarina brevivitae TaxID=323412 RepID=A0A4V2F7B9_9FLAO|nr:glycosyltransferase family 4 protein [Aquimarina brevivitae]RZS99279.1 glycosyltransferase involved in cell wall biosynthesis [Aquimarina brevivitae]